MRYHGLGLNTPDIDGDTAFHHVIRKKFRPKILSAFITAGADLDAENKKGETPRELLRALLKNTNDASSKHLQLEVCPAFDISGLLLQCIISLRIDFYPQNRC